MKHYKSEIWSTIIQWIFCQILECQLPCTNIKYLNWRPSGDGSVGTAQMQGIALCTCNWKRAKTTARPSAQDTMKTASQGFSTIVLNLLKIFSQNICFLGPCTYRELRATDGVNVRSLLYILKGLNHYWNVTLTMKRSLHQWDLIIRLALYSICSIYTLF